MNKKTMAALSISALICALPLMIEANATSFAVTTINGNPYSGGSVTGIVGNNTFCGTGIPQHSVSLAQTTFGHGTTKVDNTGHWCITKSFPLGTGWNLLFSETGDPTRIYVSFSTH